MQCIRSQVAEHPEPKCLSMSWMESVLLKSRSFGNAKKEQIPHSTPIKWARLKFQCNSPGLAQDSGQCDVGPLQLLHHTATIMGLFWLQCQEVVD